MSRPRRQQKRKPREKRVVLVLVEGDSELAALPTGLIETVGEDKFKIFFAKKDKDLAFQLANGRTRVPGRDGDGSGGDMFAESRVNAENLSEYIDDWYISTWLEKNNRLCIHRAHIGRIYQVIDMDGSYIPDDCVSYGGSSRTHNLYSDRGILTSGKTGTEQQRRTMAHRRENIEAALSTSAIECVGGATIPYRLYFFSSNLDHYLHNDANMLFHKVDRAEEFRDRYLGEPESYSKFFRTGTQDTVDWRDSWDLVRSGMNSIHRGTNYGLLIDDLLEYKRELMEDGQE